MDNEKFMLEALSEAEQGLAEGEVPIGAVAVLNGIVVARGHNRRNALSDITAHAEIVCLRDLSARKLDFDLSDITFYSTLEPCAMCIGALIHYKVGRVVFGEYDISAGACGSRYKFDQMAGMELDGGKYRERCSRILLQYFEKQLGEKSYRWEDIELPAR